MRAAWFAGMYGELQLAPHQRHKPKLKVRAKARITYARGWPPQHGAVNLTEDTRDTLPCQKPAVLHNSNDNPMLF
jgi:hypothetical protein